MIKMLNFKNFILVTLLLGIVVLSSATVFATDHDVPTKSFSGIQTAINDAGNNDRILLGNDVYSGSGSRLRLDGDKNITIQGQSNSNRVTIDAKGLSDFLYIVSGSSATIRYVNFINMDNGNHGIGAYGTVILENCSFSNSKGDSGTAVYINTTAGNSIIRNCNFINNYANNRGANDYTAGGAICIQGADNVKIINSIFRNNRALDNGGALMIRNGANGVQIIGCTFTNNTAPQGGAITLTSDSSATILNSNFMNNKATSNGGAIFSSSNLRIENSVFSSNSAANGGALYNNGPLTILSSTFKSNKASSKGGAIYANKNLTISGGSITGNTAKYGSGIYNVATLRVSKVGLSSNVAKVISISLKVPTAIKNGKKLTINVYLKTGDNIAGAIYNKNGNTYIDRSKKTPSANTPGKTFSSSIAGSKKKIKSNSKGVATRTYTVSKTAKKVAVSVSYSQSGKKWIISKSVKLSTTAPSKPKTKKYTNKKSVSSSPSSSTGSSKSGSSVTVGFSEHDNAHLASLVDMSQYKVSSKKTSYWNLKKSTTTGITDYIYKINKDGWYSGKINSKNGVDWKKIGSKPTISGTWFNLSSDSKGKYTIGNIVPKYTNNTSNESLSFFVSVKTKISHSSLTPYIKYTYKLVNKKTGSKTTKTFFEKATTDIYFSSLGFSSKLKKELTYSDYRIQVNHSDFKSLVIKIFQGKAGSGKGIEGELTADKKIRTIYAWIKKSMRYWGYYDSHYKSTDVLWRLQNRDIDHANCVDQSILLVTFLRTAGVPAYFEFNWAFGGHVVVRAYHTNTKKYILDTTDRRNDVNVINSKKWNPKTVKIKGYPGYTAAMFYAHGKITTNKMNRVSCCLYEG